MDKKGKNDSKSKTMPMSIFLVGATSMIIGMVAGEAVGSVFFGAIISAVTCVIIVVVIQFLR
jgi:hypothetical protein